MSKNKQQASNSKDSLLHENLLKFGVGQMIQMATDGSISFSKWKTDLFNVLENENTKIEGIYLQSVLLANWMMMNQEAIGEDEPFEQIYSKANVIKLSGNMDAPDIKKLYRVFVELGMTDSSSIINEIQKIVNDVSPGITENQVRDLFIEGSPTTKSVEIAKGVYEAAKKHSDALLDAAQTRFDIASMQMENALQQASPSNSTTLEYDSVLEAKREFDEANEALYTLINGPAFVAVRDAQKAYIKAIKES